MTKPSILLSFSSHLNSSECINFFKRNKSWKVVAISKTYALEFIRNKKRLKTVRYRSLKFAKYIFCDFALDCNMSCKVLIQNANNEQIRYNYIALRKVWWVNRYKLNKKKRHNNICYTRPYNNYKLKSIFENSLSFFLICILCLL